MKCEHKPHISITGEVALITYAKVNGKTKKLVKPYAWCYKCGAKLEP